MTDRNLAAALAFLAVVVGALLAVPAVFFPRATCLTTGPHYSAVERAPCEVGRTPTLVVLVAAVVGLSLVVRHVGPE